MIEDSSFSPAGGSNNEPYPSGGKNSEEEVEDIEEIDMTEE